MNENKIVLKFHSQAVLVSGLVLTLGCLAYAQAKSQTKHDKLFDLGVALLQYADDYDGKLPVVNTKEEAKSVLGPYVQDSNILFPAQNKNYFAFNFALSGKDYSLLNGKKIIAFYEVAPPAKQKRGALFLPPFDKTLIHYPNNSGFVNNSIKEFTEPEWKKLSQKPPLAQ